MRNPTERTAQLRLQALLNRRATLDAAVRVEKDKQKVAEDKRQKKLDCLVGHALRKQAAHDPEFHAMLQTLLVKAIGNLDERSQAYLRANNNM